MPACGKSQSHRLLKGKGKRAGKTRPFQFQQEILGLAVPTPEAASVGETYTMVEAPTHAMAETMVAAVRDIISPIGQIAVGEAGIAVIAEIIRAFLGTAVSRIVHRPHRTGVLVGIGLSSSRL